MIPRRYYFNFYMLLPEKLFQLLLSFAIILTVLTETVTQSQLQ